MNSTSHLRTRVSRFHAVGIEIEAFQERDSIHVLRRLNRQLAERDKRLLLLVDEAEVFISIAKVDGTWLAQLRKALFEGELLTIVASTKILEQLTAESSHWITSPFLFGFNLKHLWPFDRESAKSLVRQSQSGVNIDVAESVMNEILSSTNCHPYLIQYLCQRLYVPEASGKGHLRPIGEPDLEIDHILDAYFSFDYGQLSELEQKILLSVAKATTMTTDQLIAEYQQFSNGALAGILNVLVEVGHLRNDDGCWMLSNEFLRRWLSESCDALDRPAPNVEPDNDTGRIESDNIESIASALGVSVQPPVLSSTWPVDSEVAFFNTVLGLFKEIRHVIEQDDGHRLLVNRARGGTGLRSEQEIQIALKHWLRPMCRALDIDLNREPLSGRGYLDFKLSVGRKFRCLVEVKLFNSAKLDDGVGVQLPLYLMADRAKYGIYIPIFLSSVDRDAAVPELRDLAFRRSLSHQVAIEVFDICVAKPPSASKADSVEHRSRYGDM